MTSNNQNYDISLNNNNNNNEVQETELVEVNTNNSSDKKSGYSFLDNSENTSSTEYVENNDNIDDFTELKKQFNNSKVISNPLVKKSSPKQKIKYRKGNLHTFLYDENGIPRIVIGPDWGYALCMHLFTGSLTMLYYIGLWNLLNIFIKLIGLLVYLFFAGTYTLTCIMDPGIIPPDFYLENYEVDKMNLHNYRICKQCNAMMDLDRGVEHCVDCNICIIGNDHHCPWSSKCVGKKNIGMFRLFIFSIFLHIAYLTVASMIMAITADPSKKNKFK